MSTGPAKFAGLGNRKGAIASGYDADLVVWNPNQSFVVQPSITFHRHTITPYEGKELLGRVSQHIFAGKESVRHGGIVGKPAGAVLTCD